METEWNQLLTFPLRSSKTHILYFFPPPKNKHVDEILICAFCAAEVLFVEKKNTIK